MIFSGYNIIHTQNENLQLKTDNAEKALALEQEKLQNYMLFFILLLGVILALILYFYLQDKNKKEKQAAVYESEIRISKKKHLVSFVARINDQHEKNTVKELS